MKHFKLSLFYKKYAKLHKLFIINVSYNKVYGKIVYWWNYGYFTLYHLSAFANTEMLLGQIASHSCRLIRRVGHVFDHCKHAIEVLLCQ